MNFYATHYHSGEEVQPGDRILWAGKSGTVVFVLPNIAEEWTSAQEWLDAEGFMLDTELAGLVFENESDEDLDFIGRKK